MADTPGTVRGLQKLHLGRGGPNRLVVVDRLMAFTLWPVWQWQCAFDEDCADRDIRCRADSTVLGGRRG